MSVTGEAFLATIYTDARARDEFLADPVAAAMAFGLDADTAQRLAAIDREGLRLAAESFRRKAESKKQKAKIVAVLARAARAFLL